MHLELTYGQSIVKVKYNKHEVNEIVRLTNILQSQFNFPYKLILWKGEKTKLQANLTKFLIFTKTWLIPNSRVKKIFFNYEEPL
jgi:hypothetical protein